MLLLLVFFFACVLIWFEPSISAQRQTSQDLPALAPREPTAESILVKTALCPCLLPGSKFYIGMYAISILLTAQPTFCDMACVLVHLTCVFYLFLLSIAALHV